MQIILFKKIANFTGKLLQIIMQSKFKVAPLALSQFLPTENPLK